jgi:hypothetical protein
VNEEDWIIIAMPHDCGSFRSLVKEVPPFVISEVLQDVPKKRAFKSREEARAQAVGAVLENEEMARARVMIVKRRRLLAFLRGVWRVKDEVDARTLG